MRLRQICDNRDAAAPILSPVFNISRDMFAAPLTLAPTPPHIAIGGFDVAGKRGASIRGEPCIESRNVARS